jgi:hypothetical protein
MVPVMTQPRKHRCDRVIPTVLRRGGADQLHRLVRGRQVFGPMRSAKSAAPVRLQHPYQNGAAPLSIAILNDPLIALIHRPAGLHYALLLTAVSSGGATWS